MSLHLKLALGFVTFSLAAVTIFSLIAFTNARDYTQQVEFNRLSKENQHLLEMLDKSAPLLPQLQNMIHNHESNSNVYSIIDTRQQQVLPGGSFTLSDQLLAEIVSQSRLIQTRQGSFTVGAQEYLWVADPVLNTPFGIANVYQRNITGFGTFLSHIKNPLIITIFFSIWISLWMAAILANLFMKLAEKNAQLEYQANHDPLTQLPNRTAIDKIVKESIKTTNTNNEKLLFCLIDIEALKEINDSLGRKSGDMLLSQITQRLKHTLQGSDHFGRFGGNKFAVLIQHPKTTSPEHIRDKLQENFELIFEVDNHNLYVSATLGMAIYPDHTTDAQELIQKTETALNAARKLAVDFAIYDPSQENSSAERLQLTHDLRNAIHNEELVLYYQPQFDVRQNKINSVEALTRWFHPQHGFIPPDTFIEIAERTGLIKPLTDWVLRTAIKQCSEWCKMGKEITVSVNLSTRNLLDETLGQQISNLLSYWNVDATKLCLEITETAMMTNPEHARKLLCSLDKLGLRLSIDDFGTGYSSLGYLKQLPVDELKIDKSFVLNMSKDESDASIVRATVGLAHDLGLEVVAEGVEDQISQDELSRLGCEYIQGYHIARPMPHEELTALLTASKTSSDDPLQTAPANIQAGT